MSLATQPLPQDIPSLVLSSNKEGMEALRKGQNKAAFEQFKQAESVLLSNQAEGEQTCLLAVTCNNLGMYYKKVGKLHGALSYLRRALQMEIDLGTDGVTLAGTHLHLCAILSKLDKHDKAVQHALSALTLISKHVDDLGPVEVSQDDYSVLAIAYHNIAVERDCLQQYDKAAAAFKQGHLVGNRCLGENHPLTLALGKNCEAMLLKSKGVAKSAAAARLRSLRKEVLRCDTLPAYTENLANTRLCDVTSLPAVAGAAPKAEVSEQGVWTTFAHATLTGKPIATLDDEKGVLVPETWKDCQKTNAKPPRAMTGLEKSNGDDALLPELPGEALMDIVEADRTGYPAATVWLQAQDCRPNRRVKGTTRAARVVRRTGLTNSMMHRDAAIWFTTVPLLPFTKIPRNVKVQPSALAKVEQMKHDAASKIQRSWRRFYNYCFKNADWISTSSVAATTIQARWRPYQLRRARLDAAATKIQKCMRGYLGRRALCKHRAAVVIQRHAIGIVTRNQLRRLQVAGIKMNKLARGFLNRRQVAKLRQYKVGAVVIIQSATRGMISRRQVRDLRIERRYADTRRFAATAVQRLFRGNLGRKRFLAFQGIYRQREEECRAAAKIQATFRRNMATKEVGIQRRAKIEAMNHAATQLRKIWLGKKTRRKYKELLLEFSRHIDHIACIQRFARGFLVRLRMWRQAARLEEELWATQEIQRVWRGYHGRVKYEAKYEALWRREVAALTIQKNMKGWIVRVRVGRRRRRLARSEFEQARRRFKAATKIQALMRGTSCRSRTNKLFSVKVAAIIVIQRFQRGHAARVALWRQVLEVRLHMLQAFVRGFLVRLRRWRVNCKVMSIQHLFRRWRIKPDAIKDRARAERNSRKEQAAYIERKTKHREELEMEEVNEAISLSKGDVYEK